MYFAREGRIRLDREKQLVQLELHDGTSHTTHADKPDDYEEPSFESFDHHARSGIGVQAAARKGRPEMTFAELREAIAEAAARKDPAYEARFMIQQKFSLPVACPILALIGLALGASNRKDGKLGSFVLGIGVIFIYYVLLWGARAAAMGGRFSPSGRPGCRTSSWAFGGLVMVGWRARVGDQPIRFSAAGVLAQRSTPPSDEAAVEPAARAARDRSS